jgi:hypothetical protein
MAIDVKAIGYGAIPVCIAIAGILGIAGFKDWYWFLIIGVVLAIISILPALARYN